MTLDEAKAIIDRAWNLGPRAIDWNDVEEASMVIVAETGKVYDPDAEYARRREERYRLTRHGEPPPGVSLVELVCKIYDEEAQP